MTRLFNVPALVIAGLIALPALSFHAAAEETVGEKMSDSARTAGTKAKKTWRQTKKHVRDATGNGSVKEDLKDAAKNTGDSVEDGAKNLKDKVD